MDELEGILWLEHDGTTYVAETGAFGYYVHAEDDEGRVVSVSQASALQGFPLVAALRDLVTDGRARLVDDTKVRLPDHVRVPGSRHPRSRTRRRRVAARRGWDAS